MPTLLARKIGITGAVRVYYRRGRATHRPPNDYLFFISGHICLSFQVDFGDNFNFGELVCRRVVQLPPQSHSRQLVQCLPSS